MTGLNKKRLFLNLALLIVVAGLIAFIATRDEEKVETFSTLYDESIGDDAKQLVIHVEGQDDVVIQLKDEIWRVVKPSQFVADEDKVRHLFTLLSENAESSYSINDESVSKDLSTYGLDKDRLSISFNGVKMIFGKYNEVTNRRFILKADRIYLISETISGLMRGGEDGFRPQEKPKLTPKQEPETKDIK